MFLFLPARQWAGMFHVFRIGGGNGFTLYFTTKAIMKRITLPKETVLGDLYAIAQLKGT